MRYTRLPTETAEYQEAREKLRLAEVELIDHIERVAQMRRSLPPGAVVADYEFLEGDPAHSVRLSELFTSPGRPLVVYHFMYGKAQTSPCPMCTLWIDGFNGVARHLAQHVDFVVVAAADLPTLHAHARTRGWDQTRLLSCGDNTFKYDLGSEDEAGNQDSQISVFVRDGDSIRHTYSATAFITEDKRQRGIDALCAVWNVLDLTPAGRGDWYAALDY
jgi:predicted dithiol-disulfide oxidoreductase (DUF899 family)